MLVLPAIDLKGGQAVQLRQGDFDQARQYGDPAAAAARWLAAGTQYLHIVDLDAAAAGHPGQPRPLCEAIVAEAAKSDVPVQLGGGLRTLAPTWRRRCDAGVSRVVVGTAAAQSPDLAAALVQRFGAERIVVSLDAKDGVVATHAWRMQSRYSVPELAAALVDLWRAALCVHRHHPRRHVDCAQHRGHSRAGGSDRGRRDRRGRRDDHRPRARAGRRRLRGCYRRDGTLRGPHDASGRTGGGSRKRRPALATDH